MKLNNFTCRIGGAAGMGIASAGDSLSQALSRGGLNVFANSEYDSLIRGGHSFYNIRINEEKVAVHLKETNLLIALDKNTINLHKNDVTKDGAILYDGESIGTGLEQDKNITYFSVPFKRLAKESAGIDLAANIVAIGAVIALIDYDLSQFTKILEEIFAKKGPEIIEKNKNAAKAGYDFAKTNFSNKFIYKVHKTDKKEKQLFLNGSDAINIGAIKAGLKFVAEYPMTPSSSILHFMAKHARDRSVVVVHTEDEIAAINMIGGAGFAGVRALTATSGGGFALMAEGLGLAGMLEVPIVVVNVQRPGPATGLPTRTESGDLKFVLNASQGEYPKIVLSPGNINQAFYLTFEAFNLAEKYQCPVIILTDKYLAESKITNEIWEHSALKINRGKMLTEKELAGMKEFLRYKITKDGISDRTAPGTEKGEHRAISDEHAESGIVNETPENRVAMMNKRMTKMTTALKDIPAPKIEEKENAEITFITWGSTKGATLEAISLLEKKGINANLLQIIYMNPFKSEEIKKILENCKTKILVEQNYSGQLGDLISEKTGIRMDHKILNYSGRQMIAEEIVMSTKEFIKNNNKFKN